MLLLAMSACAHTVQTTQNGATLRSDGAAVDRVEEEWVRRFNANDGKGIVALYGARMLKAFPEETTVPFFEGLSAKYGRIAASERIAGFGGDRAAQYRLSAERGAMRLELHVDENGKITGLVVRGAPDDEPSKEPPVARSNIPLSLPFRGQWSVSWGGDRPEVNRHVVNRGQRRAADLVVFGADGVAFRGDGKKNEDHYAYGQEILATADGTVVTAIDGVPDNVPGSKNPMAAVGNAVILQHTESLFSVYGHLQPGKLRVQVGAKVKQGEVLGLCGNSGNSSRPHLHFQLQDGPRLENSLGVEPVFNDVALVRDGASTRAAEYTFLKGDLVGEPLKK